MEQINFFGKNAKFHHVGIAVHKINSDLADKKIAVPLEHVSVVFVTVHGCPIEIIESLDEFSPIKGLLTKNTKLYHLCFQVPDLIQAVQTAHQKGFRALSKPSKASAFGGRRIIWIYSPEYGLFELLENKSCS